MNKTGGNGVENDGRIDLDINKILDQLKISKETIQKLYIEHLTPRKDDRNVQPSP
jgi:hypothetical protein